MCLEVQERNAVMTPPLCSPSVGRGAGSGRSPHAGGGALRRSDAHSRLYPRRDRLILPLRPLRLVAGALQAQLPLPPQPAGVRVQLVECRQRQRELVRRERGEHELLDGGVHGEGAHLLAGGAPVLRLVGPTLVDRPRALRAGVVQRHGPGTPPTAGEALEERLPLARRTAPVLPEAALVVAQASLVRHELVP